jgi:hypothetical protein
MRHSTWGCWGIPLGYTWGISMVINYIGHSTGYTPCGISLVIPWSIPLSWGIQLAIHGAFSWYTWGILLAIYWAFHWLYVGHATAYTLRHSTGYTWDIQLASHGAFFWHRTMTRRIPNKWPCMIIGQCSQEMMVCNNLATLSAMYLEWPWSITDFAFGNKPDAEPGTTLVPM